MVKTLNRNRNTSVALGVLGALAVAGAAAFGISAALTNGFHDYSAETCSGQRPAASFEEAGKAFVTAAYAGDAEGMCRVLISSGSGNNYVDAQMVADARTALSAAGITPDNVHILVDESGRLSEHYPVTFTDGTTNHAHWLSGGGLNFEAGGYALQPGLFPPGA